MKKSLIIPALVLGLGALTFATSKVMADENTHPFTVRIAERFGLNQNEVGGFMQEMHEERQGEMQVRHEERTATLVADGVLTQDQADQPQARHEEMRTEREANFDQWRNMSREEKQAQMESHRQENQEWAEENGIDLPLLRPENGFNQNGFGRKGR